MSPAGSERSQTIEEPACGRMMSVSRGLPHRLIVYHELTGLCKKILFYPAYAQGDRCHVLRVIEFRGYRPVSGPSQVVVTYEFEDLEAWAVWRGDDTIKGVLQEL